MQGIQNATLTQTQHVGSNNASTAAQQGNFKGAQVTTVQGQLLPSNLEEVAMFKGNFKSLASRKTGKKGAAQQQAPKQVSTAQAMQNSAEEAGMMASKFKDQKEIGKARKDKVGTGLGQQAESLDKMFAKVSDLDKEKIGAFVKDMLDGPPGDPAKMLDKFYGMLGDVTHKYLGLLEFKEQLQKQLEQLGGGRDGDSERVGFLSKLNGLLNNLLKELVAENGSNIRAGLNITEVAMQFAMGLMGKNESTGELREFYRDYVMNYGAIFDAYQKILKRFKKGGFKKGKKFLLAALVADMNSDGPSIPDERLDAIMQDMKILRAIERMHEESDRLFDRLKRKYPIKETKRLELIDSVISFFNESNFKSVIKKKVAGIDKLMGIRHLGGKINLQSGVKDLLTTMPPTLYKSAQERRQILQAFQAELDDLIGKEAEQEEQKKAQL